MRLESISQPGAAAHELAAAAATPDERIEHLFRGARRTGQIHPLQHLVQRHRQQHPSLARPAPATPGQAPAAADRASRLDMAQVLQRVRELPPLPKAALDALVALRQEHTSNEQCAELMGRDQALVARTLRLANSAFYGVPGRVASMRDAVNLLGRRTLSSVATLATLSPQFAVQSRPGFSFSGFWRHAIAVALVARSLARAQHADDESAFTAGLLHDVGRLALAAHYPQHLAQALWAMRDVDRQHIQAEQALMGADHVSVGAQVALQWQFPADVVAAIADHHAPPARPDGSPDDKPSLADTVHVADAMAHALDLAGDFDEMVPALEPAVWRRLNLPTATTLAILHDCECGVIQLCQAMDL